MLENLKEDAQTDAARLYKITKRDIEREKFVSAPRLPNFVKTLRGIFRKSANRKEYGMAINRYVEMHTKKRMRGEKRLTPGAIAARVAREFQHVNARELMRAIETMVKKGKLSPEVIDKE